MKYYIFLFLITIACLTAKGDEAKPTVVNLKARNHNIEVKSSAEGPLYSVKDKTGKVLASDQTLLQLEAHDASLHRIVKEAIAKHKGLDASAKH